MANYLVEQKHGECSAFHSLCKPLKQSISHRHCHCHCHCHRHHHVNHVNFMNSFVITIQVMLWQK